MQFPLPLTQARELLSAEDGFDFARGEALLESLVDAGLLTRC
jgi:hypothetical protein